MAVFKKILKNVAILIGIALALCIVGFVVLYFSPKTSIFGLKWIKPNGDIVTEGKVANIMGGFKQTVQQDMRGVKEIIVKTKDIPVSFERMEERVYAPGPIGSPQVSLIEFHNLSSGITSEKYDIKTPPFRLVKLLSGNTLTLEIKELEKGWFMGSSKLAIKLDEVFIRSLGSVEIRVETKSANLNVMNLNVADKPEVILDELTYKTKGKSGLISKKGSLSLNMPVYGLNIENVNGNIDVNSEIKKVYTSKGVNIKTNSSSINFAKKVEQNVNIESTNSKVSFGIITGKLSYNGANKEGVLDYASGGKIVGEEVAGYFIKTKNADTQIARVYGGLYAEIADSGKLDIDLCYLGNISIKGAKGDISINTLAGNGETPINIDILTKSGDINLNFAKHGEITYSNKTTEEGVITNFEEIRNQVVSNYHNSINLKSTSGAINFNTKESVTVRCWQREVVLVSGSEEEQINSKELKLVTGYFEKLVIETEKGNVNVGNFGNSDRTVKTMTNYNATNKTGTFETKILPYLETILPQPTPAITIRVINKGGAKVKANVTSFIAGSSIYAYKGDVELTVDSLKPAYLITHGSKKPTIKVGLVEKLNDNLKPTAIGGAVDGNYDKSGGPIFTITNEKGKINIIGNK